VSPGLAGEVEAARAPAPLLVHRLGASCTVRDGRFVEPCSAVAEMSGMELVQILDHRTRAPRQTTLMARTVSGLTPIRCCPGCGVEVPR
jgi:hypothetical protein